MRDLAELLAALDESQLEAALHGEGPALVLAGPGSGKTRVVVARAARLLLEEGVPPGRLALLTFSTKAAREMRERLAPLVPELPFVGTLHALALKALVETGRRVVPLDEEAEEPLLQERGLDPKTVERLRRGKEVPEEVERAHAAYLAELYREGQVPVGLLVERALEEAREDPALVEWLRERLLWTMVDEFQDTDPAQMSLLELACPPPGANLVAVGDEAQAIYRFRGATPEVVGRFRERYRPKEYRLLRNYRSGEAIVRLAERFSGRPMEGTAGEARVEVRAYRDPIAEAYGVTASVKGLLEEGFAPEEVAVLVRSRAQLPPLEEAFLRTGIPHVLLGGVALRTRREVKVFLAALRLAVGGDSLEDLVRLTALVPGAGRKTAEALLAARREGESPAALLARAGEVALPSGRTDRERLRELGEALEITGAVLSEVLPQDLPGALGELLEEVWLPLMGPWLKELGEPEKRAGNLRRLPRVAEGWAETRPGVPARYFPFAAASMEEEGRGVRLATVHAAKGLEWRAVFLPGLVEGAFPLLGGEVDLEEERNLFFVALTRARERLYLSYPERGMGKGPMVPSRFLAQAGLRAA
ncbi:Putative ATP-dependent DNA helicase YjcD [bacterium HR39]|nr:Putative ATP-dependent DNA helicase YjcD [bacterium HR39]